jgi:methylated-DNA-protein-cysteine methyltransferase-like protein
MDPGDYKAWSPRWVGGAMANCPAGVPWQRVVNAQGKSSFKGERGRVEQMELLAAEGIEIAPSGRVDLRRYGWGGPRQPAAPEQSTFHELDSG